MEKYIQHDAEKQGALTMMIADDYTGTKIAFLHNLNKFSVNVKYLDCQAKGDWPNHLHNL